MYAFDGRADDLDAALAEVMDRARACPELGLRIVDTGFWSYPVWARRDVGAEQAIVHDIPDANWDGCLAAVAAMVDEQLDAREMTWRLHVFPGVAAIPGATGDGAVVVVQMCHSFGDGIRASALAAYLLGRDGDLPVPQRRRIRSWALPWHAVRAARAHHRLVRDTAAGLVPAQADSRPVLQSNAGPGGDRHLRTVICTRERLSRPTVTVGALTAISAALAGHLRALGDDPTQLGAEVPMAKTGPRQANNHFGNVAIGLYPDDEPVRRAERIAADLRQRRRRAAHPAMRAEEVASAAVPAPLLRWGVAQFDPQVRSHEVTGNTVVSSVNRGAKDLRFGGAGVLATAGFPALSPMMGVTHGVHGIGDTVAVSVHAADSAIADIDAYVERLERELR